MPDRRTKDAALERMLESVRTQEDMTDLESDEPNAVICQSCGHMVDVMSGEDLGEAVDMDQDIEFDDEADVYDVES